MRYLCCQLEFNTRNDPYCPLCLKVPNPATQRIYGPRNERPVVFCDHERGADAMDRDEAERVAKRIELHLYFGRIEYARAALEESWQTHISEKGGAVTMDDQFVQFTDDLRFVNAMNAHGVFTVRELLDTSDNVILSWDGAGYDTVRKAKRLKQELRRRMGCTLHADDNGE